MAAGELHRKPLIQSNFFILLTTHLEDITGIAPETGEATLTIRKNLLVMNRLLHLIYKKFSCLY
jgi:hypothetical protein